MKSTLRTCSKGHQYYKSSDCPVCPQCEIENKPSSGWLSQLSAPARRAFISKGITEIEQLKEFTEKEILSWHGIGKTTLPKIKTVMDAKGLHLKALE